MNPNYPKIGGIDPSSFHCLIDVTDDLEVLRVSIHQVVTQSQLSSRITEQMLVEDLADMVFFQINSMTNMPFLPIETASKFDQSIFPLMFREEMKEAINEELLSTLKLMQYFHPNPDDHLQISMFCLHFFDLVLNRIEVILHPLLFQFPLIRQFYHLELAREKVGTTLHMHFHWPPAGDSREIIAQ